MTLTLTYIKKLAPNREVWKDMDRDQEAGPKQRGVEGHGQRSRSLSCIERSGMTLTYIKKLAPNREVWKDMDRDQEAGPKQRGVEGHGQRSRSWPQIERSGRTWTEIKKLVMYKEEWNDININIYQEAGPKQRGVEGHGQRSRSWPQIERSGRTWTEIKKLVLYREEWKDMDRDQEACPKQRGVEGHEKRSRS